MSDQFTRWGTIKVGDADLPVIERGDTQTIWSDHVVRLAVTNGVVAIELGAIELGNNGPTAINTVARLRIAANTINFIRDEIDRQTQAQTPPEPDKVN